MSSGSEISSKSIVMLGAALRDLLQDQNAYLEDLVRAYDLPWPSYRAVFRTWPPCPEEYVEYVAEAGYDRETGYPWVFKLINAILADLASDNPAVFTNRSRFRIRSGPAPAGLLPPGFAKLLGQLREEGYTAEGGTLRPIDTEAPQEAWDKTALAGELRAHPELDSETLIYHVEQSDATAENENWHAAAGEARSFFEGLIVSIALAESHRRKDKIKNLPTSGQRRSKLGPCRQYLHSIGFLDKHEDETITQLYSFASVTGGHPGVTEDETSKFVRRLCWVAGHYLVQKYKAWKPGLKER